MKVKALVFALLLLTVFNIAWVVMNASVSRAAGKVQYKVVDAGKLDQAIQTFNQLGNDGWEYVGSIYSGNYFVFRK
jgi:hypothetical protein